MSSIKEFFLTQAEVDFFIKHFPKHKKYLVSFDDGVMQLNHEDQKKIVNDLVEYLISNGLDANDEPNAIGIQIEHLIDIFNPYKK
ncbi:MAG: hypothetical protein ABIH77_02195 [Pseudomonadota bacterium]|nr:hypothetical protein [Gammaproteobacteria bacterium]MBU1559210.1 hypothetical protein [Gammaproteobacteria bacterium]MBU2546717.1 hypothetical protein [Gammaproteobacteria bacterium]